MSPCTMIPHVTFAARPRSLCHRLYHIFEGFPAFLRGLFQYIEDLSRDGQGLFYSYLGLDVLAVRFADGTEHAWCEMIIVQVRRRP